MKRNCSSYLLHIFGGRATNMTEWSLNRYHSNQCLHKPSRQPGQGTEQQQYLSTVQYSTEVSRLVQLTLEQVH